MSASWLPPSGERIDVGILGATGVVGQQFVALLADHPWFRVTWLAASERSAGQRYGDLAWRLPKRQPEDVAALRVSSLDKISEAPSLLFSGLDSSVAGEAELAFAASGRHVISNAKNHRMDPLVPLLIPEVNPDHLALLDYQRRARGWTGSLVTNPNCATIVVAMVLGALRQFQPGRILVTTMQALSGAGYPGVASLDALGNVIPYIGGGEEEKIETEPRKILGRFEGGRFVDADFTVSASVHRVAVTDGHTMAAFFRFGKKKPSAEEAARILAEFRGEPQERKLPSAPERPVHVLDGADRPQPRLDRDREHGMAVSVGRVRTDAIFDLRLEALVHNTIRGAAGAAILNAELMHARGLLQ